MSKADRAKLAAMNAELALLEAKLKSFGVPLPKSGSYEFSTISRGDALVMTGNDDNAAPQSSESLPNLTGDDNAAIQSSENLPNLLCSCHAVLQALPIVSLARICRTSKCCSEHLSTAGTWRTLYSLSFPHELSPKDAAANEPRHPLSAAVWKRLYVERRLDGAAAVPCFLSSPAGMASATLDPGAFRLIIAFYGRLIQQIAAMFASLLLPLEPANLEAALGECARLLETCSSSAVIGAKMILRQLEASGAFGCDGGTLWSFEQERAQLSAKYKELLPTKALAKKLGLASAGASILDASAGAVGVAACTVEADRAQEPGEEPREEPPADTEGPRALPPPIALKVGAAVEAIREEGDDEWEVATISAVHVDDATVSLTFADRFRATRVPLGRIRPLGHADDTADGGGHSEPPTMPTPAPMPPAVATEGTAPLLKRRVVLRELSGRPELNGNIGTAISWDAAAARYGVRLESGGSKLALKPQNLALLDEAAAAMAERDSQPSSHPKPTPARPSQAQVQALYGQLWQQREAKQATEEDGDRIVDVTDL